MTSIGTIVIAAARIEYLGDGPNTPLSIGLTGQNEKTANYITFSGLWTFVEGGVLVGVEEVVGMCPSLSRRHWDKMPLK